MRYDALEYYRKHSWVTDIVTSKDLLDNLPESLEEIRSACQNVLIHKWILKYFGKQAYGVKFSDFEAIGRVPVDEYNLVTMREMVSVIRELKETPLNTPRVPLQKLIVNCRHYAVFFTSLLRERNIPARVRSGCAGYLEPRDSEYFMDHYVAEYWNQEEERWVLVDAQLDDGMMRNMGVTFDPCDVPREEFVVAGQIWNLYRNGKVNPDKYGIETYGGVDYLLFKVVNDVACLNKEEVLPWDAWGLGNRAYANLMPNEVFLIDRIAKLSADQGNNCFHELRYTYQNNESIRKPEDYTCGRWIIPS